MRTRLLILNEMEVIAIIIISRIVIVDTSLFYGYLFYSGSECRRRKVD